MNIRFSSSIRRKTLALLWAVSAIAGLVHNSWPHYSHRMYDFMTIKKALDAYHVDHGVFPIVEGAVHYLDDRGANQDQWLPGLVPQYLSSVPIDPRYRNAPNRQYLYFSNGNDYKLIAHGAEDAPRVARLSPNLTDPARPSAYGIWTSGAKAW